MFLLHRILKTSPGGSTEPVHNRALDKREYLVIIEEQFSYFSLKPSVVISHLSRLNETVQMRDHNVCFYAELTKITTNYYQIPLLI